MIVDLNNTENWEGEMININNLNLTACDLNEILSEVNKTKITVISKKTRNNSKIGVHNHALVKCCTYYVQIHRV